MALFQRVPERKEYALPYTLSYGKSEFMLIVGLGNPGAKYKATRHNIGFDVIDELAKQLEFDELKLNKDFKAMVSVKTIGSSKVILAKPQTFMNESGQSVRAMIDFYKIGLPRVAVLHDELSIKFGQIRTRVGGQAAGHNGIKSIITHCGAEFGRVRIGIKNPQTPKEDTSAFVLAKFNKDEQAHLTDLTKETALLTTEYIYSGDLPHDTRSIIL